MKKPAQPWTHEQVRVPIYAVNLHVIVAQKCAQIKAARLALASTLGEPDRSDDAGATWTALCSWSGRDFGLFFSREQMAHGTVAHEVFHVAHRIMEFVGDTFGVNNHEPYAYLVEWITDFVYLHVKPKGRSPL